MTAARRRNEDHIFTGIARFNIKMFGLTLGALTGFGIFIATNWLLIKGGQIDSEGRYVVGPHLQLLSQFFIGYKVSFAGSIIGFIYGFAIGTLCGAGIGWIYDRIVEYRN
jgi:hypothetical protein